MTLKPGKMQTIYIKDAAEYFQIVFNNNEIEIENIMIVSEEMICVTYTIKNALPSSFTNVVIACMVTSYARCWLYDKFMSKLHPSQLNYVDTDSIIYITNNNLPSLDIDDKIGSLTDEIYGTFKVKDSIDTWVATGNKSYAYKLKNNPHLSMVKVKGFTLKLCCNILDIDFETMLDIILKHPATTIELKQRPLFVKDKANAEIFTKDRYKKFKFQYDNKVIISNFQTKPYGYVGNYPSFESLK
jgi:hypothetical protein